MARTTKYFVKDLELKDAAAAELSNSGIEVRSGSVDECEQRHVKSFINFTDPTGNKIDLVVGPSEGSGDLVRALRHRWPMGPLLDPTAGPTSITVGALEVGVDAAGKVTIAPGSRDGPGR